MDAPFPPTMMDDIRAFLADDGRRGRGADLYPEVFATGLFFPLQRQAEMRKMIAVARGLAPKVVFEIGADKGGGLYHWVKCLPSVEVAVACEVRGTPYWKEFNEAFPTVEFLWLGENSHSRECVDRVGRWLGKQTIDVLFIDGDKSAMDRDFAAYLAKLSPRSVVFFHDINDGARGAPRLGFERVKASLSREGVPFRASEIVDLSDVGPALERERQGIPPANAHEGWLRHWKGHSCGVGVIEIGGDR